MILSSLNKVFAKGTYIKLTMFALILQVVSLFRNYPLNPPCGRVLEITKGVDMRCGPITIDEDSHTVKFSDEPVELSPTEFRLLQVLIENKNRVLSKSFLLDEVWGITFESESTVADTYISYLRKKLHRDGFEGRKTVRGVGFVIQEPKPESKSEQK
jgi:two-component system OmpR family response regulator